MRAGQLRHRVTIQTTPDTVDAYGNAVDGTAVDGSTVWASIKPLSGREFIEAQQVSADVTHRVRMRYASASAINPTYQLSFDSRTFSIVSAINIDERNEELEIMCKEVV